MNCQRAEALFSALWEDELPIPEKNSLNQHFESCVTCKREYEEFVHTLDMVHTLPRLEAPPEFAESVLDRVRAGVPVKADPWWQRVIWSVNDWSDSLILRPAYAAAAAVLVVAVASFAVIYYVNQQEPVPGEEMARSEAERPVEVPDDESSAGLPEQKEEAPAADEGGPAKDMAARDDAAEPPAPFERRTPIGLPTADLKGAKQVATANEEYPPVPDSLFNHEYDFEFGLDRYYFERLPDGSGAGQAYPLPDTKGRPASVTF